MENLELSGALIFCSTVASDNEWLCEAGILPLLLDVSVLFTWDALSLKDLANLLSSGEINLTDLNSLKPSERSFVVHISSLLSSCSFSWQIRLDDLKGALGCEEEISYLSPGGNNCMLQLCILLLFPNSLNISSSVKSTTELLLNNSVLLLLWVEYIDYFRSRSM